MVDAAFEGLRVRVVERDEARAHDPEGSSFRNINTPEEFRQAGEEWRGRG
jgi:molybdopterin-guanine dinucleotide biosynthesis protein A